MALLEDMQAALQSPEFKAIQDPATQLTEFQRFLRERSPEFAAINDPGVAANAAIQAMQDADPTVSWGDTLKAAGTVAAGFVPFAGPAIQTAIVGEARPWTKAALPEDATLFEQVFSELTRGVVEDALMFGPLLRAGKFVSGAGAIGSRMAASSGRVTQTLAPVIEHAIGLGTTGALFGVLDNIEHEEFNPGNILLSGGMGAVVGALVGIPGATAAFRRNPELGRLLNEAAEANPRVKDTLDGIMEQKNVLTNAVETQLKMPADEAQGFIARALSEDLTPSEFHGLRQVMGKDPDFLKTDLGLAVLQRQREHLMPKVFEGDTPLQIRVEDAQGRASTIRPMNRSEVRQVLRDHQDGKLYVTEVVGRAKDTNPIRAQLGLDETVTPQGAARQAPFGTARDLDESFLRRPEVAPRMEPGSAAFASPAVERGIPLAEQFIRGQSPGAPRTIPVGDLPYQAGERVIGGPPAVRTPPTDVPATGLNPAVVERSVRGEGVDPRLEARPTQSLPGDDLVRSSYQSTVSKLEALGTPLQSRQEMILDRFDLRAPMSPIERQISEFTGGRLGPQIDEALRLDTIQPPAQRMLAPGIEAPPTSALPPGQQVRGALPADFSRSPGSSVKLMETGTSATITRQDGPLIYVKTPNGEVPAIPMSDGTARVTVPSAPAPAVGAKARKLGQLSDQELIQGSDLLAKRALESKGSAKAAAVESRARYLDELDRRFGSRPEIPSEGGIASHINDCL